MVNILLDKFFTYICMLIDESIFGEYYIDY